MSAKHQSAQTKHSSTDKHMLWMMTRKRCVMLRQNQNIVDFGTRILFHKMQKICHDVCTIETTGTLICYYCKLYLHEYIHNHTQTYTHADWANHMHTICIRMLCITREKIMRLRNNPAHNSKTFSHLVSVPHSRKPWSALYWGREKKFHGSTASISPLCCYAYPSI